MSSPDMIGTAEATLTRKHSRSSGADSIAKGEPAVDPTDVRVQDPEKGAVDAPVPAPADDETTLTKLVRKYRVVVLGALAALILGWWISATVLKATRHRWCVYFPPLLYHCAPLCSIPSSPLQDRPDLLGLVLPHVSVPSFFFHRHR